ncbi:sulfite exporter TauE/SafE family protein [Zhouia sp. PK063]|uniref:sulfite exporter TauE/SafE family protein n=1 Tax=Zhouia sp. PK063 TaxID=3373602 RepID=UPI0037B55110
MIITAIILGFFGSLHCAAMCGPIAFMLPLNRTSIVLKYFQLFLYHLGRLTTYSILGLAFGALGSNLWLSNKQQILSIIIGTLMIVVIMIPYQTFQQYNFSKPIFKLLSKIKTTLGKQLHKRSNAAIFSIGILNGLLPCGMIYMALFGAIAMGSPFKSSFYMFLFGVGTLPLMTIAASISQFLNTTIRKKVQQAIPFVVVLIGMLFIVRGLGLGIPYLSPSNINLIINSQPDCVIPVLK